MSRVPRSPEQRLADVWDEGVLRLAAVAGLTDDSALVAAALAANRYRVADTHDYADEHRHHWQYAHDGSSHLVCGACGLEWGAGPVTPGRVERNRIT